ncbi:hypothetical protein PLICRDRAFT_117218, partial [Plicaturopsis crispa FD-325 SS-3]
IMASTKSLYEKQGFVVVPDLIHPDVRAELEAAANRAIARTRDGSWTQRRTVGKQFPPYGEDNPDSWGVQHVMHPDLDEPVFSKWYTSDALVSAVCELVNCNEEELQMELFNMLINPLEHDFALRWHRDDVKETTTAEEEEKALGIWNHGIQWNTALYKDSCLYVVPGSHLTPRTPEQRAHSSTLDPPANPLDMPGSVQLVLQPGETVFYNSNILHCAAYNSKERRATLHATMGDVRGGSSRARNILQHGLTWMKENRFRDGLDERGKKMLSRLVAMQESVGGNVSYSLAN